MPNDAPNQTPPCRTCTATMLPRLSKTVEPQLLEEKRAPLCICSTHDDHGFYEIHAHSSNLVHEFSLSVQIDHTTLNLGTLMPRGSEPLPRRRTAFYPAGLNQETFCTGCDGSEIGPQMAARTGCAQARCRMAEKFSSVCSRMR